MKLHCYKCDEDVTISVTIAGPHLKAHCRKCWSYIKFLNKAEKTQLQIEEDEAYERIKDREIPKEAD